MAGAVVSHVREYAALTYVMQGDGPITGVNAISSRIKTARERLGLSQPALAKLIGVSPGAVGNWESGTRGQPRELLGLAAALQVSPSWLQDGGPAPWDARERSLGGSPDTPGAGLLKNALAQDLSHVTESINPITIQWELVLSEKLPSRFRLVIRDDSMALDDPPSMRVGHWAEFEPASEAPAGQVVLVADAACNVYIRKKVEKTPGRWEAHARRAADYLPLDSVTDGLRILAVQVGQGWK